MAAVLSATGLYKSFGRVQAVNGIDLEVQEGTCFGLLGPNGAGKSTTIEMLEGLMRPSAGDIRFRGAPLDNDYRERIGIQFQSTALQDHLTVLENLKFFGRLYPHPREIDGLIKLCQLDEFLDRDSRKLSGGQRQRLLLAIALVNDPELLFLDEPTTGLDPQARRNFWELVTGIKAAGKTVVLTTHYMEEAYLLCDEIVIVDQGKVIARGSPSALLAERFSEAVIELPAAEAAKVSGVLPVKPKGEQAEIHTADIESALTALRGAGVSLAQLRIRQRTLEDLFIDLTGRELRT